MQNRYYDLLTLSYEDEIGGAAYFKELKNTFMEPEIIQKLNVLVDLEAQTSSALYTLIKKHNLVPQPKEHINNKAVLEAKTRTKGKTWHDLLLLFAEEFPPYVDEFKECFELAPAEDKAILQQTVEHELALIEFVQQELNNSSDSLDSINRHLKKYSV